MGAYFKIKILFAVQIDYFTKNLILVLCCFSLLLIRVVPIAILVSEIPPIPLKILASVSVST